MKTKLSAIRELKKFSPEPLLEFMSRLGMDPEEDDELVEEGKEMTEYLSMILKAKPDKILHLESSVGYSSDDPIGVLFEDFLEEGGSWIKNFPVLKRGGDMGDQMRYSVNPDFPLPIAIITTSDSFEFYSTEKTLGLLIFFKLDRFAPYQKQTLDILEKRVGFNLGEFAEKHKEEIAKLKTFGKAKNLGLI